MPDEIVIERLAVVDGRLGVIHSKRKYKGKWLYDATFPGDGGFGGGRPIWTGKPIRTKDIKYVKSIADLPLDQVILRYLEGSYGSLNHAQKPHNVRMAAELRTLVKAASQKLAA